MLTTHSLVLALAILTFYIFYNNFFQTGAGKHRHAKLQPANPEQLLLPSYSPLLNFSQAAVISDSKICSEIGSNLLKLNGSAVDAAIGTLLCNGLVTMQSNGLGGGMLLVYYARKSQKSYALLAREVAPLLTHKLNLHALKNATTLLNSAHTIAVPAEVMGYAKIHKRFGLLEWPKLVQPTLNLCRSGFILSKHMRDALLTNKDMVLKDTHLMHMFFDNKTQNFYKYGQHILPARQLCGTYELLLKQGPGSFYQGVLAEKILADLKHMGSYISRTDFKKLQVKILPAPTLNMGNYKLHLLPPPGSGLVVGFVLNILQNFRESFQKTADVSDLEIHRMAEALKFGFAQRWQLDTRYDKKLLNKLLNSTWAREISKLMENFTLPDNNHYGVPANLTAYSEYGTGHVSVLAKNGDAVSVTSSINFYFGSGRTGKRTGILFNNVMSDFALDGIANYFQLPNIYNKNRPQPGQSPMSSMAPSIITDKNGQVRLIIGAAGGSKIISVLVQVLVRTLWKKNNIKLAIDAARFHHQLYPNVLEYEYGILQKDIDKLKVKGHKLKRYRERGTIVNAIEQNAYGINACVDFRKEGGVVGY